MNYAVKNRIKWFTATIVILLCIVCTLLYVLRQNIVFFVNPYEAAAGNFKKNTFRIGGVVQSFEYLTHNNNICQQSCYAIMLSDAKATVKIIYRGILPPMFRVNQGAILFAQKVLTDNNIYLYHKNTTQYSLISERILIKHDERYISKEEYQKLRNV